MAILAYGINYRTAPVALRERIAFPEDALDSYLNGLRGNVPSLQEAAILSQNGRWHRVRWRFREPITLRE